MLASKPTSGLSLWVMIVLEVSFKNWVLGKASSSGFQSTSRSKWIFSNRFGGFAAVYLATDTRQGNRLVALKDMICGEQSEFNIRLNFFQREAIILRAMANSALSWT